MGVQFHQVSHRFKSRGYIELLKARLNIRSKNDSVLKNFKVFEKGKEKHEGSLTLSSARLQLIRKSK